MGTFISRLLYGENKWGKYGALLLLPNEVLFEAFKFLDRRQLTNLERVCPRFHRIISDYIGEAPFLRLEIGFGFNDSGLETLIKNEGKMRAKIGLKKFPFLRFKTLWLFYTEGSISIDAKLQLLHYHLQLFETALSDSEKIILSAAINQNDQSQFRNHSQLITHLREKVLPIFDSSPVYNYNFFIDFQSGKDAAGNVIGQILQLPPINCCQEVGFLYANESFIQLPVEVISNWLNRNSAHQFNSTGRDNEERKLLMNRQIRIQNAVEMCDRLKMAFTDANSPAHPFSFSFSGGPVENELILNENTNEEFVMGTVNLNAEAGMSVVIQRRAKENTRN